MSIVPVKLSHIRNIPLANPSYQTPSEIYILLGADVIPLLLLDREIFGQCSEPMAIETIHGCVLMEPVDFCGKNSVTTLCLTMMEIIDTNLKQFWVLELPSIRHFRSEDTAAELFYKTTTTHLKTGRFMV